MANCIWIGTDGNYATNGNWSNGTKPTTNDDVRLVPTAAGTAISSGLNQSAEAIDDFIVEEGFNYAIASSAAYLQIDPNRFEFSGGGESWIDIGSAAIPIQIFKSAGASAGKRGLYLKGSGITVANIVKGKVGIAWIHGETSTVATARVVESDADLWLGSGVTLTTLQVHAGNCIQKCAATTVTVWGGTLTIREASAITTLNVYGGTVYPEGTGTIGTLNAYGGTVDFTGSGAARTVTTFLQNPGSEVIYDPASLTITNRSAPANPIRLTSKVP